MQMERYQKESIMTDKELDLHTKKMKFESEQRDSQTPRLISSKEDGWAVMIILFVIFILYPIAKLMGK